MHKHSKDAGKRRSRLSEATGRKTKTKSLAKEACRRKYLDQDSDTDASSEQCIALHSLYSDLGTCQLFLDVYASDSHATVDLLAAGLSVLSVRNTLHELRMCVCVYVCAALCCISVPGNQSPGVGGKAEALNKGLVAWGQVLNIHSMC